MIKNSYKRALSWLLVLTLLLSVLPQLPMMASASGTGATYRVDGTVYDDFQTAMTAAKNGSGLVVLASSGTLTAGEYTVPAGVTFVIPCVDNDTGYRTVGEGERFNRDGTSSAGNTGVGPNAYEYASLTVSKDAKITVYGDLMVNSVSGRPGGFGTECDITGGYGQINLEGSIVVASGAKLNCFGYIKGSGMVTALSGAEVGDLYIVRAWRGGTQAKEMYKDMIYPMNEYDCHNIECALRINYGASLMGRVKMYASGEYYYTSFPQVHVANGLIRPDEGGYVIRTYENGKENFALYGGADFGGSTLEVQGIELSTSDFLYPIDGDISYELHDGSYTFAEDYKMLPGASVTVTEEAELAVEEGNALVFYEEFNDVEHDGTEYPSDRPAAVLQVEEGARFTNSGIFSGTIETESTEIFIGENPLWELDTKEANGVAGSGSSNYVTIEHSVTIKNEEMESSISASGSIVWEGYADYALVQKAIAAVPKNMEFYYEAEGVSNVKDAVGRVVFDLPASEQAAVDAMADPILEAIASLTPKTVTIYLDANGGTITPDRLELACVGTYGKLPTPTREQYKFNGWYDLEGNRVRNNQALKTRYNVTLVAAWTPADADYDDLENALDLIPTDLSIYSAASVKALQDAEASINWDLTSLDQAKVNAMTQAVLDAIAGLDYEKITVTFDANGGTVSVGSMKATYSKTLGTLPVPVREGYIFQGWQNSEGKAVTAQTVVASLKDMALTASWQEAPAAPADYTAVEAALAAVPSDLNVYTEASVTALLAAVDAVDYSLTEESQAAVDAMAKAIADATAALAGKTVYILYNANGGKARPDEGEAVYGQPIGELVVPTRKDYVFVGWINTAGETVTAETVVTSLSDIILKAQWERVSPADYTALKEALDSVPADLTAYTDASAKAVETAKKAVVWTYTAEDQTKVDTMTANLKAAVAGLQIRKVTVTFDANGGTMDDVTLEVPYGNTLGTLPTPKRAGFTFKCWRDATGKKITASSQAFNINGMALTADWEAMADMPADYSAVEEAIASVPADLNGYTAESVAALNAAISAVDYSLMAVDQAKVDAMAQAIADAVAALEEKIFTVTFDAGEGTCGTASVEVPYGSAIGQLPAAQREGYLFLGWLDESGSAVNAETVVTADMTLTASWEVKPLEAADYSAVEEAIASIPADLNRYTAESVENLNAAVAAVDYTLLEDRQAEVDAMAQAIADAVAALEEKIFTVTFDAGEGTCGTASVEVPYGAAIGQLPDAQREGYLFLGWLDESGSAVNAETVVTADMTLTASWEEKILEAADYSAVDAAIESVPADLSVYTEESVAAVNTAVNAVVRDLTVDRQAEVDAMAQAIADAVAALRKKNADYSMVDTAIESIPADLFVYTEESVAAVNAAVNAVVRELTVDRQAEVDAMAQAIVNAVNALERKEIIVRQDEQGNVLSVEINVKPGTTELTIPAQLDAAAETPVEIVFNAGAEPVILNIPTKNVSYLNLICVKQEDGTLAPVTKPCATETGVQIELTESCTLAVVEYTLEELPNPFPDVQGGNQFKNYVLWGYYNGIVGGKRDGSFDGNGVVTRGQFIIMLWRAAGKPEPTQFQAFPDVSENSSFYKAVCWAVEMKITNGQKDGTFGVNQECTRGHVALFLYRFAGSPEIKGDQSFSDVTGGTYYKAVCWLAENEIAGGQKDGTFGVSNACKRFHAMKFLYLYLELTAN